MERTAAPCKVMSGVQASLTGYPRPACLLCSMDIPQALLDAAAKPVVGSMSADKLYDHFALVHHQVGEGQEVRGR